MCVVVVAATRRLLRTCCTSTTGDAGEQGTVAAVGSWLYTPSPGSVPASRWYRCVRVGAPAPRGGGGGGGAEAGGRGACSRMGAQRVCKHSSRPEGRGRERVGRALHTHSRAMSPGRPGGTGGPTALPLRPPPPPPTTVWCRSLPQNTDATGTTSSAPSRYPFRGLVAAAAHFLSRPLPTSARRCQCALHAGHPGQGGGAAPRQGKIVGGRPSTRAAAEPAGRVEGRERGGEGQGEGRQTGGGGGYLRERGLTAAPVGEAPPPPPPAGCGPMRLRLPLGGGRRRRREPLSLEVDGRHIISAALSPSAKGGRGREAGGLGGGKAAPKSKAASTALRGGRGEGERRHKRRAARGKRGASESHAQTMVPSRECPRHDGCQPPLRGPRCSRWRPPLAAANAGLQGTPCRGRRGRTASRSGGARPQSRLPACASPSANRSVAAATAKFDDQPSWRWRGRVHCRVLELIAKLF